jgi:recombinational DNA repair protein (RecF pathway)
MSEVKLEGFILETQHFTEYAGLVAFLSSKGITYCYDKDFYFKYQRFYPIFKEARFAITLHPGADEHRFYLRKLEPIEHYQVPSHYIAYFQWLISLALLTQKTNDHPEIFFKFYYRFLQQLKRNAQPAFINFSMIYIELHVLESIGSGDFITHYEHIMRLKNISPHFNEFFLKKMIDYNDFKLIQEYIGCVIYQFFSWNKGFDVFKECIQMIQ